VVWLLRLPTKMFIKKYFRMKMAAEKQELREKRITLI